MDPRPFARGLQAALIINLGVDHEVTEVVAKLNEIAFGVDDALLHPWRGLFEQPAQQMGFARTGIALHQEAGRQQFLKVQVRRGASGRQSNVNRNGHLNSMAP